MNAITFNFVNNNCLFYLNKIFEFALHCSTATTNSFPMLKYPLRKTNTGQKTLSCLSSSLLSNLPEPIKKTNNLDTFKHYVKKLYLNQSTYIIVFIVIKGLCYIIIIIIITAILVIVIYDYYYLCILIFLLNLDPSAFLN